jgi:flagellar hook-associated protein 3 FlgL
MLPTLDSSAQQFLTSLERLQSRMDVAQRQLSSGKRVETASDAPDAVSALLQLHADIQRNQDIKDGLGRVKAEVTSGEQAVSTAVDQLERAIVIATQGTGTMQTATTRATMAEEISGILQRIVGLANTTVEDRYIFSGDLDQAPSYKLNLAAANGVDRLQVASATRQVQGSGGMTINPARSANDIFDHRDAADNPASDNVFAALNGLRTALLANDDQAIRDSVGSLETASKYLNGQLTFYGRAQNAVASALSDTTQVATNLTARLSELQDADSTAAILELTLGQTLLQAALTSRAKMPSTSLFDVL